MLQQQAAAGRPVCFYLAGLLGWNAIDDDVVEEQAIYMQLSIW